MWIRVRQVAYFLAPRLTPEARAWALDQLNAQQQALFSAMRLSDQAHAIRVARRLAERGAPAFALEAALLHDCAKPADYTLFWRCAGVLLARWLTLPESPALKGWKRQLQIYRWHDHYGLALAEQAGTSAEAVALLRAYQAAPQEEAPAWLGPLKACDDLG